MELDEAAYLFDLVARVPQRLHPLPRHAGPDDVVVVEADAARADRAGLRLADVMEEGGKAQEALGARLLDDGDRMGEHVLMPVDRVLLESEGGKLRQEL